MVVRVLGYTVYIQYIYIYTQTAYSMHAASRRVLNGLTSFWALRMLCAFLGSLPGSLDSGCPKSRGGELSTTDLRQDLGRQGGSLPVRVPTRGGFGPPAWRCESPSFERLDVLPLTGQVAIWTDGGMRKERDIQTVGQSRGQSVPVAE